jgi:hypothetical protein
MLNQLGFKKAETEMFLLRNIGTNDENVLFILWIKNKLSEEQCGFQNGISCMDGIFTTKLVIEKR